MWQMRLSVSGYIAKPTTPRAIALTGCRPLKNLPKRCRQGQETRSCVSNFSGFLSFTTEAAIEPILDFRFWMQGLFAQVRGRGLLVFPFIGHLLLREFPCSPSSLGDVIEVDQIPTSASYLPQPDR